ncbi:MAG TPA: hypothetical protein VIF34_08200 [Methylocystis sp.]
MPDDAGDWEGFEVDGLLYGYVALSNGKWQNVIVQKAAPLITSLRTTDSVMNDELSEYAQERAAKILWPHMELLGHFHSHPHLDLRHRDLDPKNFDFSVDDKKVMAEDGRKIYIVATVCKKNRKDEWVSPCYPLECNDDYSVILFQMADLIVYIKASVHERSENGRTHAARRGKVVIRCPLVMGSDNDPMIQLELQRRSYFVDFAP